MPTCAYHKCSNKFEARGTKGAKKYCCNDCRLLLVAEQSKELTQKKKDALLPVSWNGGFEMPRVTAFEHNGSLHVKYNGREIIVPISLEGSLKYAIDGATDDYKKRVKRERMKGEGHDRLDRYYKNYK